MMLARTLAPQGALSAQLFPSLCAAAHAGFCLINCLPCTNQDSEGPCMNIGMHRPLCSLPALDHLPSIQPSSSIACSSIPWSSSSRGHSLHTSCVLPDASQGASLGLQMETVCARLEAAESRLGLLEAKEGIRQTVHSYAQFLDASRRDPQNLITRETIAALFTPSARIDFKQYGTVEELDSIQPFLQRYASSLVYSKNHVANVIVEVNKTSEASPTSGLARFYMFSAGTLAHKKSDVWAMETVLATMRKGFDEKWRIRSLESEPGAVVTPFSGPGWNLARNVLQEQLDRENSK